MNEKLANPAPLGLMGFGMTTVLLNIHNAGFFPKVDAMIFAMGIFYGGIAQIIAGILEYRKGNTFGVTAFCSYGFFWLTLVGLWVMPKWGWADKPPEAFMGWYLFMWGLFTFMMGLGTLQANKALQVVFFSLTILFWLLAARDWMHAQEIETWATVGKIAGFEGIFCGASAIYLAMAEVLNERYGRTVLPIGEPPPKELAANRSSARVAQ